jgi:hypothetical protein
MMKEYCANPCPGCPLNRIAQPVQSEVRSQMLERVQQSNPGRDRYNAIVEVVEFATYNGGDNAAFDLVYAAANRLLDGECPEYQVEEVKE